MIEVSSTKYLDVYRYLSRLKALLKKKAREPEGSLALN